MSRYHVCVLSFSFWTLIWTLICISTCTFLLIVVALKPLNVGTEKVSIWKPWKSLHNVCQSVRCFDVSLLKWSWQKSSGFILWAPGISILKFTAIPGRPLKKKIFYQNKMFDSEWRQKKRLRITKCGRNHCKSSHQGLKMLRVWLFQGLTMPSFENL